MTIPAGLRPLGGVLGFLLVSVLAWPAMAGDLRVEVDHAIILRLDKDADIVHIANPNIADVSVESPRLIFVVGLAAGQTGLFVLDKDGNEMISRDVVVVPSQSYEVTVNRNTAEVTLSCDPRCVVVSSMGQAASTPTPSASAGANASTATTSTATTSTGTTTNSLTVAPPPPAPLPSP